MSKLGWYYNRLKAMGPKEVLLRVREHGLKMTEAKHFDRLTSVGVDDLGGLNDFPSIPFKEDLTEAERAGIKAESDAILAGHWHVLRGHEFEVEFPPKWHQDYLCGKSVPNGAALQAKNLDHRSLPEGIDPRIVWETSRWIQLVRLSQYVWLEEDAKVSLLIIETLENWVKENPLGHGINWTSPMEPGIRLTNFTWIHAFLTKANLEEELSSRLEQLVADIIPGHAWWVWRYHSVGTSANNHLLGELCGLMMATARWRHCEKWSTDFNKLSRMMSQELLIQFASDGGNKEQGLHYHLFAWEMGWQAIRAMQYLEMEVLPNLLERMGSAAHFFATVVSPEEPWDYGDSDDAHVTPVFLREETCLSEWQAWMQGHEDGDFMKHWLGVAPHSESSSKHGDWTLFSDSGYAIYNKNGLMLRFDGSPLGFGSMAAHGHLDALHVSMWYEGKALIIDPGTGSYFDNRDVRDYFLSAEAHNGPCLLDSDDYPVHAGPFLWTNHHADPMWTMIDDSLRVIVRYGDAMIARTVEVNGDEVLITDEIQGYKGKALTTWLASPAAEVAQRGSIQRDNINLACDVDGKPLAFKKSEIKRHAGHCSEYFRADHFSAYTQVESYLSGEDFKQTTTFNIKKQRNEY